jgi:hypothetical protein
MDTAHTPPDAEPKRGRGRTGTNEPSVTDPMSSHGVAVATSRRMIGLVVGASLFSFLFVLSLGYAIHSPRPHGVRIDVVASAATVGVVRAALDRVVPGGFHVDAASGDRVARRNIEDTSSYGALVVPPAGPDQIFTAGAAGVSVQQAVLAALTGVAHAQGRTVQAVDLVPLPTADRAGQSGFAYQIGLLIPGVIGSVGFFLLGRRARLWVRAAAAASYAVLSAALGVFVLDVVLGALTGSPWALMAVAALAAAAFVLTVAGFHALFGLPGTGLAVVVLLVVGNSINGSTVPVPMLPGGYRQIAPWLPNAAATRAFRDVVYFSGHGLGQPLATLTIWVLVALIILAATDALHVHLRRGEPLRHEQIHATSILQYLRDRPTATRPAPAHND